jgi:hypothetical protein
MNDDMSSENEHPPGRFLPSGPLGRRVGKVSYPERQCSLASPDSPNYGRRDQTSNERGLEQAAVGESIRSGGSDAVPKNVIDYRNRPIPAVEVDMVRAIRLIRDPEFWLQEDYAGGEHLLIRKTFTAIEGINPEGNLVALPAAIIATAEYVLPTWIIEGVLMQDRFVAFDLLLVDRLGFRNTPYWLRYGGLRELLPVENEYLQIAETATKLVAKGEFLERLQKGGKNGVTFKKFTATRDFHPSPEKAFSLKYACGDLRSVAKLAFHR